MKYHYILSVASGILFRYAVKSFSGEMSLIIGQELINPASEPV